MGKKGPSAATEFTEGFMQPLSDALKAYADIAVAQANANAQIISAQQKTMQAAVGVNAPIIHELDRPFLTVKGRFGRGKNAPQYEFAGSVLDMYALGDLMERSLYDAKQYADGEDPSAFSYAWDEVRTPRTQISGKPTSVATEQKAAVSAPDNRPWYQKLWEDPWITSG